jgi:hypothetical protein
MAFAKKECPTSFWLDDKGRREGFLRKLDNGLSFLKAAKCVVCPKCGGDGCTKCQKQGILPKSYAEA